MKHVIRAIILLIILYVAAQYYQDSEGILGLIYVLLILVFMYLIAGIIRAISKAVVARRQVTVPTKEKTQKSTGGLWLFLIILLFTLTYAFKEVLGNYSFKAFLFLDNLVKLSDTASPPLFWGMLGLLVGAIYGSFVAWKKYKLHATVNLIPIGIFLLFIVILYMVNHPLRANTLAAVNNLQTAYAYNLVTATTYNAVQNKKADKSFLLLDNDDKTAWITNVSAGTGEEIRFSFGSLEEYKDKHLQCVGFAIKNGYRKSPTLWNNYATAKSLAIKYNGRLITNAVVNARNNDYEEIKFNPIPISSFDNLSISINTVNPGAKYPTRVAISELVPVVEYEQ